MKSLTIPCFPFWGFYIVLVSLLLDALYVEGADAPAGNGDVNGDGRYDLADVVRIVEWRFLGGHPPVAIVCPPPGGGPLPATGQTKCYDDLGYEISCDSVDYQGQDAFYYTASCPKEYRFADNGDGTVTDRCTGLIWQQNTADTNGDGSITPEDRLDWQDSLRYCERLEFAGCSDWRLPNIRELSSIADHGRFNPAIDPVFSAEWGKGHRMYWTSTNILGVTDDAYTIAFTVGNILGSQKILYPPYDNVEFVRAVRGGL